MELQASVITVTAIPAGILTPTHGDKTTHWCSRPNMVVIISVWCCAPTADRYYVESKALRSVKIIAKGESSPLRYLGAGTFSGSCRHTGYDVNKYAIGTANTYSLYGATENVFKTDDLTIASKQKTLRKLIHSHRQTRVGELGILRFVLSDSLLLRLRVELVVSEPIAKSEGLGKKSSTN
ncbi:hypothetical protein CHU98_g2739 [Xylaria longipes]|nr:hypothetical protein CHU98_g2739 [Xylaria longipes]